jgi:uncharacterized protein YcaQ
MPRKGSKYSVNLESVRRLWFHRQGLTNPRGRKLTRKAFVDHLECTGGIQIDTSNVLERPHYLTLWSRFGSYNKSLIDKWIYRDRVAYEYWGHVASIVPASRLPLSRRRMLRFRPKAQWWGGMPSQAAMRNVLRRLRDEGPLESIQFEKTPAVPGAEPAWKSKRTLEVLWHRGKTAITERRHFRRVFDLAERVYPDGPTATTAEYEDGWLLAGLSGNGIASEKHLDNYITAPRLLAPDRRKVIARNLKAGRIAEVEVEGFNGAFLTLPEHLERLSRIPRPRGTTLICPFDSFLWQRDRAEHLLDFYYRIEVYTPAAKRKYGYFVMPILHDGALVGRLDPKLHRDRGELEIKAIFLEPGLKRNEEFEQGLAATLHDLATFVGADKITLPKGWRRLL